MMIRVTDFELVGTYSLVLTFNDGTHKRVNLRDWLYGPVFEPLRDPEVFAQVRIEEDGETISWPNGADFAPEFLYEMESEAEPV